MGTMGNDSRQGATGVAAERRPQRWWCDLRWITAGVVTVSVVWLAWGLFGPEPAIRVSRETTYVIEPLDADGLPDYAAAWLAMAGPAPPPEENAAVLLLQTCWPLVISRDLPAVCRSLGIPKDPPSEILREPHHDAASGISRQTCEEVGGRPWTTDAFPEMAAWLRENQVTIDRIVAASKRPRYWLPIESWLPSHGGLPVTASHFITTMHGMSRILMSRLDLAF